MTTAEAAADVQVPEIGEHSSPGEAGAEGTAAVPAEEPPTTFTFTPNGPELGRPSGNPPVRQEIDYGGPIVVPRTQAIVTPGTERWFFYELNKIRKRIDAGEASSLELAFFWLERAGASDELKTRIALLPFEEWERFYSSWMKGAADSNLGE
jgi:hypothetical protein